jgi:hypothetical protein
MKRVTALFLSLFIAFAAYAQSDTIPVPEETPALEEINEDLEGLAEELQELESELEEMEESDVIFETPYKTEVSFGENEVFIIEENGDTTIVQLGDKGLSIVEDEDGTSINIIEMDEENEPKPDKKKKKKFKPHYAGFEMGINNFLTADNKLPTGNFMNLNTGKSWNYNLNFIEYGFGLGTSYVGLVTGMGIEWSNYVFDAKNTISEDEFGNIGSADPLVTILDVGDPTGYLVKSSSLRTSYLTAPLLLEFQFPAGKKRVHISAGVVGAIKLTSKTRLKYESESGSKKESLRDDFSLSPFRYGATVRVGYRMINLYANYYFSPLFSETTTPELYPFSIGLCLIPF